MASIVSSYLEGRNREIAAFLSSRKLACSTISRSQSLNELSLPSLFVAMDRGPRLASNQGNLENDLNDEVIINFAYQIQVGAFLLLSALFHPSFIPCLPREQHFSNGFCSVPVSLLVSRFVVRRARRVIGIKFVLSMTF
jgi:hypothetical protein